MLIINSSLGFGGALSPLCTVLPLLCMQRSFTAWVFKSFGSLFIPWSIRAVISVMVAVANFPSLDLGIPAFQGFNRMVVDAYRDLSLRFNSMSKVRTFHYAMQIFFFLFLKRNLKICNKIDKIVIKVPKNTLYKCN